MMTAHLRHNPSLFLRVATSEEHAKLILLQQLKSMLSSVDVAEKH